MEQMMKIDKCCCTCIHCDRRAEKGHTSTYCDLDDKHIGYVECFERKCESWELDPWQVE